MFSQIKSELERETQLSEHNNVSDQEYNQAQDVIDSIAAAGTMANEPAAKRARREEKKRGKMDTFVDHDNLNAVDQAVKALGVNIRLENQQLATAIKTSIADMKQNSATYMEILSKNIDAMKDMMNETKLAVV